jgi:uncharacterized protein YajQ (UPF0234 family)
MLNEARNDLHSIKVDISELEELRDMRADIERKEKAHADLISSQAKRLDELETLYREEQVRVLVYCVTFDFKHI